MVVFFCSAQLFTYYKEAELKGKVLLFDFSPPTAPQPSALILSSVPLCHGAFTDFAYEAQRAGAAGAIIMNGQVQVMNGQQVQSCSR
jgi:hypothetical protein